MNRSSISRWWLSIAIYCNLHGHCK